MPIYCYFCPSCEIEEEAILPINRRDVTRFHLCGCEMQRKMTIPLPPIMKESTKERVTGGLNEASWMKPEYAKMAMGGFD